MVLFPYITIGNPNENTCTSSACGVMLHVCVECIVLHHLFQMANGRVVYVDHRNRRTQWERPTVASQRQQASHVDNDRRRMAYTLARRNPGDEASHAK